MLQKDALLLTGTKPNNFNVTVVSEGWITKQNLPPTADFVLSLLCKLLHNMISWRNLWCFSMQL